MLNSLDAVRILLLSPKININYVFSELIQYEIDKKEEITPFYIAVNQ